MNSAQQKLTIIEPHSGWRQIDLRELYEFRDLFTYMVWRNIRVRYAQSVVGIGWALIQPLFSMIVFTIVFGRMAKIDSDGVPYPVFTFSALVPWTYFASSLQDGANTMVSNAPIISKIYFPRLLLPLSEAAAKLLDFSIALTVLAILMIWYGIVPGFEIFALPLLIVMMILASMGMSMWLTAVAIQYRDVRHAMTFLVQLLMYAAPVVYPASMVPEQYRLLYALNPMVGVIEGFRASLLGTRAMPWDFIAIGTVSALIFAITGGLYFRRQERLFADVA